MVRSEFYGTQLLVISLSCSTNDAVGGRWLIVINIGNDEGISHNRQDYRTKPVSAYRVYSPDSY